MTIPYLPTRTVAGVRGVPRLRPPRRPWQRPDVRRYAMTLLVDRVIFVAAWFAIQFVLSRGGQ